MIDLAGEVAFAGREALDAAVAAAYGGSVEISDDGCSTAVGRLLALNGGGE